MRKTSHDGGDSTSITSGFENETRKTSVGIIKTKKNSIKRKVQNFSHESDDTVIEPLLQIDKSEASNRSAKYLLSKTKTDSLNEREHKLCNENQFEKHTLSKPVCSTGTTCNSNITIHNHMNTNVFVGHDSAKFVTTVKSPILVEINGSKAAGNSNQTSSIFTTAKIHADSITKTMTPVQVTPLPILSTMEGNTVKAGISPDFSQSKNIEPSTSSNSKSINCFSRSDNGKSDTNTEPKLKNISTLFDSRPLDTLTKAESKFSNKSCDGQKTIVTSVTHTKDAQVGSKNLQPIQSTTNTISETSSKSFQEPINVGFKENFRLNNTDSKIEIADSVLHSNQSKSSVTTAVPKDLGVTKKEDYNISYTGSTTKQLQRQKKTIVEDPRDTDVKNIIELDKFSASTQKDSTSKGKSPTIVDMERKQPSIETSLTKSKDKVTQSTAMKTESVTTSETKMSSLQMSTAPTKNSSLTSNMIRESTTKPLPETSHSGNLPIRTDSTKGKNICENNMNKTADNTSVSKGSAKSIALNSTNSIPPSHEISSSKPDTSKGLKESSRETHKSLTDNSSLSNNNKIMSANSTASIQPTQATEAFKSDFKKGDLQSDLLKLGKESSKGEAIKPIETIQSSVSLTKVKPDSVKGKKVEIDSITKKGSRKSHIDVAVKLPVTTGSSTITKVNATRAMATTSMSKSTTTNTKPLTKLSDEMDFKSSNASIQHKFDKPETISSTSVSITTTNSFLPTSTTSATKTSTASKLLPSEPSSTNSVTIKPNTELSNTKISTASSMPSTSPTNSTLAKSSSSTKPSQTKPKSTEKHGKI